MIWRFDRVEDGQLLRHYWTTACQGCAIKAQCSTGTERRINAVRCAVEVHRAIAERNAAVPADQRIEFRIGVQAVGASAMPLRPVQDHPDLEKGAVRSPTGSLSSNRIASGPLTTDQNYLVISVA